MSKVDEAWRLFSDLQRQYPHWPSTFSPCACGRGAGRGSGPCALCIEDQLSALVGHYLAERAHRHIREADATWGAIFEKLGNERQPT